MQNQKPYTVSEFIEIMNAKLRETETSVVGEVSELKISAKGHVYPVIKDKETGHILPCTIWQYDYELSGIDLQLGMEVLVSGCPSFYGPFGKLSFNVKTISLVGEGALKKAYEQLKAKLQTEELFNAERKRALPLFPKKIGVITSIHGAVIYDFSNNLRQSGFKVKILDTRVEGPESGRSLTLAVRKFRKIDIDVLVLIRGGGSMQSLAGYDNEALVREIANFPVPVITGIGHHQDVPLATLVSDASESTPSMVATLLGQSWHEAETTLQNLSGNIFLSYEHGLTEAKNSVSNILEKTKNAFEQIFKNFTTAQQSIKQALLKIDFSLANKAQKAKYNFSKITTIFKESLNAYSLKIQNQQKLIESNSPERQLRLGYSLAFAEGRLVKSIKNIKLGENLKLKLSDGTVDTTINNIST